MYSVSQAYRTAHNKRVTNTRITGTITSVLGIVTPFSNINLNASTFGINSKCVSNSEFELGSVYAAELTMTLKTDIDRYTLYGAKVKPYFAIQLEDKSWEELPLGEYIISEANRVGSLISIKAYDRMTDLSSDEYLLTDNADGSPFQLLTLVSELTGIELANTEEEIQLMPNGMTTIGYDSSDAMVPATPRELLSYVAAWLAGFAYINEVGKLAIKQFSSGVNYRLPSAKKSSTSISDYSIKYDGVRLTLDDLVYLELVEEGATGQILDLKPSPFFENGTEETIRAAMRAILNKITPVRFIPLEVTQIGPDPSIQLGDLVEVEGIGKEAGTFFQAYVMSYNWKFRGTHTVSCLGKNPLLTKQKDSSNNNKLLQEVAGKVSETELIYNSFQNIKDIKIKQSEFVEKIIKISYLTKKTTSGEFKAEIIATSQADEPLIEPIYESTTIFDMVQDPSTLQWSKVESQVQVITGYRYIPNNSILRFSYWIDDNEITMVQPVETMAPGSHIIWLYYPLESIVPGIIHKFEVGLIIEGGPVLIPKFHIMATLIGQGMVSTKLEWDGTLEYEDSMAAPILIPMPRAKLVHEPTASLSVLPLVPLLSGFTAELQTPTPKVPTMHLSSGFVPDYSIAQTIISQTVDSSTLALSDHVELDEDNNIFLKNRFLYSDLNPQPLGTGHMLTLRIDTTSLTDEIKELEVEVNHAEL